MKKVFWYNFGHFKHVKTVEKCRKMPTPILERILGLFTKIWTPKYLFWLVFFQL